MNLAHYGGHQEHCLFRAVWWAFIFGDEIMSKEKFVKLTRFEGDGHIHLNLGTETIKEVVDIPKDDKYGARTRITTTKSVYLVNQPADKVMAMCGLA